VLTACKIQVKTSLIMGTTTWILGFGSQWPLKLKTTMTSSHQSREKYAIRLIEPVKQKNRLVCKNYINEASGSYLQLSIEYSIAIHLEARAGGVGSCHPRSERNESQRPQHRNYKEEAQCWAERERQDPRRRALPGG
jgi:hypothetical protein